MGRRGSALAVALAAAGGLLLLNPATALALPDPTDAVDAILPDALDPSQLAGELVGSVIKQLFEFFFGELPDDLGTAALRYLLTYPTVQEEFRPLGASQRDLQPLAYSLAAGFFLLALLRLLTEDPSGVWDAPKRLVLAMVGITAWPWAFERLLAFEYAVADAVLATAAHRGAAGMLMDGVSGGAGGGFGLLVALVSGLALIALFVIKVMAIAALGVLWLAMPLALACWVYPGTAHFVGICSQCLVALLAGPVVWTIILVVFASVGPGALTLGGSFGETFMRPLVSLALLVMLVGAIPALWSAARARGLTAGVTHGRPHPGAQSTVTRAVVYRSGAGGMLRRAFRPGSPATAVAGRGGAGPATLAAPFSAPGGPGGPGDKPPSDGAGGGPGTSGGGGGRPGSPSRPGHAGSLPTGDQSRLESGRSRTVSIGRPSAPAKQAASPSAPAPARLSSRPVTATLGGSPAATRATARPATQGTRGVTRSSTPERAADQTPKAPARERSRAAGAAPSAPAVPARPHSPIPRVPVDRDARRGNDRT